MPKMGLVLQGGGALGAYEYGAGTRLVELGWEPVAVTGVSIGAATAAAVAGARGGNIGQSLKHLWQAITLESVPFLPSEHQAALSIFGNPRFWRLRHDVLGYRRWTSLCDVSPMRKTLAEVCDFDQINDPSHMRVAVDLLTEDELENLPIFIVNLFADPFGFSDQPSGGQQRLDWGIVEQAAVPIGNAVDDSHRETGRQAAACQNMIWRERDARDPGCDIVEGIGVGDKIGERHLIAGLNICRCDAGANARNQL
jgi:hypothetical protein